MRSISIRHALRAQGSGLGATAHSPQPRAPSGCRRGQSTVEYAVLAAVVVGACLVMQIYMKRGVSGKLREGTDRIGEQFTPVSALHDLTQTFKGTRTETTQASGFSKSEIDTKNPEKQVRGGTENPVDTDLSAEKLF